MVRSKPTAPTYRTIIDMSNGDVEDFIKYTKGQFQFDLFAELYKRNNYPIKTSGIIKMIKDYIPNGCLDEENSKSYMCLIRHNITKRLNFLLGKQIIYKIPRKGIKRGSENQFKIDADYYQRMLRFRS